MYICDDSFKERREKARAEGNLAYDNKYDAFYHKITNEWLEAVCGNTLCEYCNNRPFKHII